MDLSSIKSVLVIKPSSLGDVVHTLPAVNLVAKRYPGLELRWVVDPRWSPLLEGHPSLVGTIAFPRERFRGPMGWCRFPRWGRSLKDAGAEVALDFQGLLRSALMGRMSGAGCVVGMSDAREGARFLFNEVVSVDASAHAVQRYLTLAAAVGARRDGDAIEYLLPDGVAPEHEAAAALSEETFVLLHPYSRGRGKALEAAHCERFCRALAPAKVVIVGMRPEQSARGVASPNVLDLSNGTGLLELLWLMRRARFCVSTDSGPMHLAAAVTSRLLGIHTWTDPRAVGPAQGDAWVWKAGTIRRVRDLGRDDETLAADRSAKVSGIGDADVDGLSDFVAERLEDPRE